VTISSVIAALESIAHPSLQESYDNAGLLTGSPSWECKGILCSLDVTEEIIEEAVQRGCNMVVAHHPIIFGGLKKITGRNYVERTVISAIKNDIAIYAIHTNLDNVLTGVSHKMADKLGLEKTKILAPKPATLQKLFTFVPEAHINTVRDALFAAGGGHIGNYSECSFAATGEGSFKAGEGTDPFVGEKGQRHLEKEIKLEIVFPSYLQGAMITALKKAHPYEEVAFDLVSLANPNPQTGAGIIGELREPLPEPDFLRLLKDRFGLSVIRHTPLTGRDIKRVALCGGAGSFLVSSALAARADIYITGDMKYHEFFDADGRMVIADIGHFESEQFTIDLLAAVLAEKFPTFAVLKTGVNTNPVRYFQ